MFGVTLLVILMIMMIEPFHIQFMYKKIELRSGIPKQNTQHIIFRDFVGGFSRLLKADTIS